MAIRIPIITDFNNGDLKKAQAELQKFADKSMAQLKMIGVGAAVGLGLAVNEFAKFDDKMTQSTAIMGDVSESMRAQMEKVAREVAKSTTFSAEQAAESYYFLASAGLDAAASMKAMPQVASFAQAGMFDMARATDLLTDAQSALGLTIRDDAQANMLNMARVSDVLVKANTLANASVEQFSTALTTKAGPAMRAVGMDVEEGVAVLAAFADQGVKSELAGTNFAIVLRDLQTKAIDNKDAFEKAGVAVYDARGEMRNMADIVSDLEKATAGMSDEQKKATFAMLGFSDKSMGALAALMGTSDAIRTYEAGLRSAGGTTQDVADKQLQSFNSQLKILWSQIQDVAIEVGANLVPTLKDMVQYLNTDEGRAKMQKLAEDLAKVAIAAGNIITMLANLLPVMDKILIAIGAIRIAWGVLIGAVAIYNSATLGALAVTNALKFAIASTGIGLAIIGLGMLVSGFMSADTGAQQAGVGAADYAEQLRQLQLQAGLTAGAVASIIPASPTNSSSSTKPLNPKPGEVYTWYSVDENGIAIWKQQTWTGKEWTKPKVMTYDPPTTTKKTTSKTAAEILAENRAKLADEIKGYNQDLQTLTRLGARTVSSYEKSVADTFVKVRDTITNAVDLKVLTAHQGKMLGYLASFTEKALTKIAQMRANLADSYDKLTQKLADAKALRESTRDQFLAMANLADLAKVVTETVDATGKTIETTTYSASALITNLKGIVEGVKSFRDNMAKLREMGLDPQLYQQIIASGMEAGGATAKAIIDGGPEAVSEINKLFAELGTVGEDVGVALSEVMYNGGESAIQKLIDGVLSMDAELAKQAEEIASTFFTAFEGKINGTVTDLTPFINTLKGLSTEIDTIATSLGEAFRLAFIEAVGNLEDVIPAKTQPAIVDTLPPINNMQQTGQAIVQLFGNTPTATPTTLPSSSSIFVLPGLPAPITPSTSSGTTVNVTVNATVDATQSAAMAGKTIGSIVTSYVKTGGSVLLP